MAAYDVIGDIHGYAGPLERLLDRLGYRETDGAHRHPDQRQVVFVGDFIDRGPDQLRVLEIARRMVDAGSALAVMGNHEFNAIAWTTPDDQGGWCRTHSEMNRHQHRAFLEQVGEDSARHLEWIDWFRTLPMWLDLGGLRVVHACWHPESMEVIGGPAITDDLVRAERGSPGYEAVEMVLKGPEIHMGGATYADKDGHERTKARLRWWDPSAATIAAGAEIPGGSTLSRSLSDDPIDLEGFLLAAGGSPVLYGHYWRSGENPRVDGPLTACLDWSIAKDGQLVAYRWSGENHLLDENLVGVR